MGPRVVTGEDEVLALREVISGEFVFTDPGDRILSLGVGGCGEDLPAVLSRVRCVAVGVREGVDPFEITQRLDAFLGPSHEGACFGVTIEVEEDAVAW